MNAGQYDKDCSNEIFRRLPGTKESEAYLETGDPDAARSENVSGEVKHPGQEKSPISEVDRSQVITEMHRNG